MDDLISIVLPTYNGERLLPQAIDSILSQTYKNWELIIVNDCSNDKTQAIADEYSKKDARIRVLNNQENKKLPASLNIGFSYTKGDYLTWTSDDNYYKENALEEMLSFLKSNPDTSMVCCDFDALDNNDKLINKEVVSPDPKKMLLGNCCGACFLYTKEIAQKVGPYAEDLFLVEDYNYWLRVGLYGLIRPLHKSLYVYRRHDSSLSSTRGKEISALSTMQSLQYLNSYIDKYPSLSGFAEIKRLLSLKEVLALESNSRKEKINNLLLKIGPKELYDLLKASYRLTGNRVFIRTMRKLGLLYSVKAFLFSKKEKGQVLPKSYTTRLSSEEWGN